MKGKAMAPHIHRHNDGSIEIIGEPAGLDALGHLLILKAKMGNSFSAKFSDGTNKVIHITSSDDFLDKKGD